MTHFEVLNVRMGGPRYDEILVQLDDPQLAATMWADAGHRKIEDPGKIWTFVLVHGQAAAWAAAVITDSDGVSVLRCSDNYERRGPGREHQLWRVAYRHRHTTVVVPAALPGLTYLYAQPLALHEADGWYRTGLHGISYDEGPEPHPWWELRRDLVSGTR